MEYLNKKWNEIPINRKKNNFSQEINNNIILNELLEEIKKIPSDLNKTKNIVLSSGNFNSPVMFIGEAPKEEENLKKEPFVGNNGQFLNKMLASIGVDRKKVYITNIFFWQIENNRILNKEDINMVLPIVKKHIYLQNPKIIIILGSVAAKNLLNINVGILKIKNTLQSIEINDRNYKIYIACHPAYILKTNKIQEYTEDFFKIQKYLIENNLYDFVKI